MRVFVAADQWHHAVMLNDQWQLKSHALVTDLYAVSHKMKGSRKPTVFIYNEATVRPELSKPLHEQMRKLEARMVFVSPDDVHEYREVWREWAKTVHSLALSSDDAWEAMPV